MADRLKKDRQIATMRAECRDLVAWAAATAPDVVIMSATADGSNGWASETLRELRVKSPASRVIVLLDENAPELVVEAFRSGARGVFCSHASVRLLARCIHKVHEGQFWLTNTQLEFLLASLENAPATRLVDSQGTDLLSKREQQVVRWLVDGHNNHQIAAQLSISENTVKNYLFRIYNKLGVSNRVEVALYAASQSRTRVFDQS